MDFQTVTRTRVLADIITEQAGVILQQAEQINRLNEMLRAARDENEALKKSADGLPAAK